MTLTKAQFDWLAALHRHGGSATLERGAVFFGGSRCPNASCISFLNLIVKGALEGKNGKLQITPYGYRILNVPEQGSSPAECRAHNPEVGGSTPPPASTPHSPLWHLSEDNRAACAVCNPPKQPQPGREP